MPEHAVSVVIPCFNYARFLGEAIESVLAQTAAPREIIVVDDGSTDDSTTVARRYGSAVVLLELHREGVARARNHGIEASKGSVLAFLDADDAWAPRKLEAQLQRLDAERVGLVYCGVAFVDERGVVQATSTRGRSGRVLRDFALMRDVGSMGGGSGCLIPRAALDRVGRFDERLSTSADWDLFRRLATHYDFEYVPETLVRYRLHGSGMHRNVDLLRDDMLRAFGKMFVDEAAHEVHPLRRHSYGNLFLILAASYWHAGRRRTALAYLARGLHMWPPSVVKMAVWPFRRLGSLRGSSRSRIAPA